ncbi:MAG: hypothetical protein NZM04_09730 [Methylacidiphilales bacterium]|nr:hypothetical protein [Candidatus Methylacidiphilales bacterium]
MNPNPGLIIPIYTIPSNGLVENGAEVAPFALATPASPSPPA